MAELDHLFICVSPGAPEADLLVETGLTEGPRNTHPGQGTANRRFFFENAMLELLWVVDEAEAQSEIARPTLLWERWSQRESGASPFGVILRPTHDGEPPPFDGWTYAPPYFGGLSLHIAHGGVEEPMRAFFPVVRHAELDASATTHALGVRYLTAYKIHESPSHLLDIEFDGVEQEKAIDLRPALPLRLSW